MNWNPFPDTKPDLYEEVLVYVDGHRGPSWSNNYCLVAYLNENGEWRQERHGEAEPIVGVIQWGFIDKPNLC